MSYCDQTQGCAAFQLGDCVRAYSKSSGDWTDAQVVNLTGDSVTVAFLLHGTICRKTLPVQSDLIRAPPCQSNPARQEQSTAGVTVLVPEPERRGMSARQFDAFFQTYCGTVISEGGNPSKPICLPTSLAKLCVQGNIREPDRWFPYEPNLHAVNDFFIKRHTSARKTSYAELLNPSGKFIEFFISHHWGEDFGEFVQSLLRHAKERDNVYWCCAFANNQHEVSLGPSLEQSPFHIALSSPGCRGTVLNLNRTASALFRVWCVYEAFLTHTLKGKTFCVNTCQGPMSESGVGGNSEEGDLWITFMFDLLQDVDVASAKATDDRDKVKIMEAVQTFRDGGKVGAEALNAKLKKAVASQAITILAKNGQSRLLQQALDLGVHPDETDSRGIRPLTYAVALHGEMHQAAQILLKAGADARAKESAKEVVEMFGQQGELAMQEVQRRKMEVHAQALEAAQDYHVKRKVAESIIALQSSDVSIRCRAAKVLGQLGQHAASAAPELAAALKDSDADVRGAAASALGQLGQHAQSAAPELAAALKDSDALVRGAAAYALGKLGQHAQSAAPELVAALSDSDAGVRRKTAYALGQLGQHAASAAPELSKAALKDSEAGVRRTAASALGKLGQHAAYAVPEVAAALKDSDALVRGAAASDFGQLGQHEPSVAPEVVAALKDSDADVRRMAASDIGQLRQHAATAAPELAAALKDSDADVRRMAASALGQLRQHAASAAPDLVAALKDSDADVRCAAAETLGQLRQHASSAAPDLVAALKDSDADVRRMAAYALGQLGQHAVSAAPELVAALKDSDALVRGAAASALGKLEQHAACVVPELAAALSDIDAAVRRKTAYALGQLGQHAASAAPELSKAALKDSEAGVRRTAASALGKLGQHAAYAG